MRTSSSSSSASLRLALGLGAVLMAALVASSLLAARRRERFFAATIKKLHPDEVAVYSQCGGWEVSKLRGDEDKRAGSTSGWAPLKHGLRPSSLSVGSACRAWLRDGKGFEQEFGAGNFDLCGTSMNGRATQVRTECSQVARNPPAAVPFFHGDGGASGRDCWKPENDLGYLGEVSKEAAVRACHELNADATKPPVCTGIRGSTDWWMLKKVETAGPLQEEHRCYKLQY